MDAQGWEQEAAKGQPQLLDKSYKLLSCFPIPTRQAMDGLSSAPPGFLCSAEEVSHVRGVVGLVWEGVLISGKRHYSRRFRVDIEKITRPVAVMSLL